MKATTERAERAPATRPAMPGETLELFGEDAPEERQILTPGACVLRSFACPVAAALLAAIGRIETAAPFRHLLTPGGLRMSVAMTNSGRLGWISDRRGYRYDSCDPLSGKRWPAMPAVFTDLAAAAAAAGGFPDFVPDACLINRYQPGARLTLHQDRDEGHFDAPIVSVSLGLPAVFLFGGDTRAERQQRVPLQHGDVVVWGGAARMRYHGVLPIKDGYHEKVGTLRLNLTFRRAG
jgi:alkylated DNA repair protein (DNA oxidative demethylase)